ncbi:MAG: hypothetical protein KatS3mg076_1947 [Candidatus Binatia bacterium]|nr:MAG: hypothetical protein KatS3mg076_1947 [Candidatus Binatia bacterium]
MAAAGLRRRVFSGSEGAANAPLSTAGRSVGASVGRGESRSAAALAEAALFCAALLLLAGGGPGPVGAALQAGVTAASAPQAGDPGASATQAGENGGAAAAKERLTLRDLPVAAQGAISRVLGRDTQAYQVRVRRDGRLEAGNPRHGVRAVFAAGGVELHAGGETWRLRWAGIADGDVRGADVMPVADRNRVEYRRGVVTEWYVNGPLGLEQGFTVAERPAGLAARAPLRVEIEQAGTLHAEMKEDGRGLVLRGPGGSAVLAYRGLAAWDAKGQELPARLELAGATLAIEVDDAGAEYPVTIDPFVRQAELTASDGAAGDFFGYSVALDGDTMVVGARFDDIGANTHQGSAYVFVKPGTGWVDMTETAKLTASDGAAGDEFGRSVAISGDTAVVGAPGKGSAYVFVEPATGWAGNLTETAKLTASDGVGGFSVAIDSDTVVVGAPGYESGGSAYVFVRRARRGVGRHADRDRQAHCLRRRNGGRIRLLRGGQRGHGGGRCVRRRQLPRLGVRVREARDRLGGYDGDGQAHRLRRPGIRRVRSLRGNRRGHGGGRGAL